MTRVISLLLILILGLSLGFWMGRHQENPLNIKGTAVSERKPLYYRHPMNPQVTSTTPTKDEMGMDYVAVYEGERPTLGQIKISPEKVQKLGVKTATVIERTL